MQYKRYIGQSSLNALGHVLFPLEKLRCTFSIPVADPGTSERGRGVEGKQSGDCLEATSGSMEGKAVVGVQEASSPKTDEFLRVKVYFF